MRATAEKLRTSAPSTPTGVLLSLPFLHGGDGVEFTAGAENGAHHGDCRTFTATAASASSRRSSYREG